MRKFCAAILTCLSFVIIGSACITHQELITSTPLAPPKPTLVFIGTDYLLYAFSDTGHLLSILNEGLTSTNEKNNEDVKALSAEYVDDWENESTTLKLKIQDNSPGLNVGCWDVLDVFSFDILKTYTEQVFPPGLKKVRIECYGLANVSAEPAPMVFYELTVDDLIYFASEGSIDYKKIKEIRNDMEGWMTE